MLHQHQWTTTYHHYHIHYLRHWASTPAHSIATGAALQLAFSLRPFPLVSPPLAFPSLPIGCGWPLQVKFCQSSRPFISHSIEPRNRFLLPLQLLCWSVLRMLLPSVLTAVRLLILNVNSATTRIPVDQSFCLQSRTSRTAKSKETDDKTSNTTSKTDGRWTNEKMLEMYMKQSVNWSWTPRHQNHHPELWKCRALPSATLSSSQSFFHSVEWTFERHASFHLRMDGICLLEPH